MSTERIKELLELMEEHALAELELEEGDFKLRLAKHTAPAMVAAAPLMQHAPTPAPVGTEQEDPAVDNSDLTPLTSPIVGTFYQASSPEAAPFVKVGDTVTADTVVCIVEAMKVMNEIKAEKDGVIAEILVKNGEAIEYGQPLFLLK